ncbi:acyl-CoA dehydrogenase [Dongshaea marina]|uniref:acyl-CoA dehydrogenase n=1 Tax=Dongshaea marina TaxID=2047966 RepID=UPI000D3E741A|nr:acyl-CoA dehydrogenase [Dongshaea marina]
MIVVLTILVAILALLVLLYRGKGFWSWISALVILIVGAGICGASSGFIVTSLVITALLAALFGLDNLRRTLVTLRLMKLIKKGLPKISETEQTALNAGTVWWDAELFSGRPNWQKLAEFEVSSLTDEEQAFLDGPVEELCRITDDWQITQEREFPPEVWRQLKEQKFFGMIIPKEYGGLGFSAQAHSAVVQKISSHSLAVAVVVMVPNSLGPAELLLHYGTDAQKQHYLPRLASGEEIPCFALTEPKAGSDAGSIQSQGVICKQEFEGEETLGILLDWRKRYITLAPVATVIGLAFKLRDPERLLGEQDELGITCALIPSATPGVEVGQLHDPMGIPFPNGPTEGKDVFIPLDWVIGGEAGIGQGWRMLMESLASGRSISLPSLSLGASKLSTHICGAYASVRHQFGLPIGRFEGVAEKLAHIGGLTYGMDAARRLTCGAVDSGERPSVLSCVVKAYLTENMRQVVIDAMDILGGAAISKGPRNLLSRAYDGLPIGITVEGANILTRSMIIFGQGSIRAHPYVPRELEAAASNDLYAFDKALWGHINFTLGNGVRAAVDGITRGRLLKISGHYGAEHHKQTITRYSSAFVLVADVSMLLLGSSLKRREILSGRMADALSWLYLATSAVKRFEDEGSLKEDELYLDWFCSHAYRQIEEALRGACHHYPIAWVGRLLHLSLFALGKRSYGPSDKQTLRLARRVMGEQNGRSKLSAGISSVASGSKALGALEEAYEALKALAPIEEKIHKARKSGPLKQVAREKLYQAALDEGVISSEEFNQLEAAQSLMDAVIEVDSFGCAQYKSLR